MDDEHFITYSVHLRSSICLQSKVGIFKVTESTTEL